MKKILLGLLLLAMSATASAGKFVQPNWLRCAFTGVVCAPVYVEAKVTPKPAPKPAPIMTNPWIKNK